MPATIKLGSSGPDVKKWQLCLANAGFPASVTGNFEQLTDQFTREFQKAKGLTADGIVGPMTWSAMLGTATPAPATPSNKEAETHRWGREVLLRVWPMVTGEQPNLATLQIAGAQAHLESNYGRASYKLLDHGSGATVATSGVINNWGAVQTSDPNTGFLATDTSPLKVTSDNPKGYYDHLYKKYPTPEEGAKHFVEHMTTKRPTSWDLMRRGDIDAWAEQMHAAPGKKDPVTGAFGYFEQKPSQRALGIEKRIAAIAAAHGEPVAATRGGPPPSGGGGMPSLPGPLKAVPFAGLGGLVAIGAAVAWYFWRFR